jgi:DNA-binding CsgD family transcriptional regulator
MLPLAALITGDAERTREALKEARRIRIQSPQPAAVNAGDFVEVIALAFLGTAIEREQWLDRRIADFGDPATNGGPPGPLISLVARSIAATWNYRPDAARDWAHKLRTTPLAPWTDRAAQWLEARTEPDDGFVKRVEPLARTGLSEIPILDALLNLDLFHRSTGAVQRAAHSRIERALLDFGGDRLLMALFPSADTKDNAPTAAKSPVLAALSDREREIATLLLEGLSYAQIGRELFITRSTVSFHLTRIYAKTGTTSRHELAEVTHNQMT